MFLPLDKFKLVFTILYIIVIGIIIATGTEVDKNVQDILVIVTHLPAIAILIVIRDTLWVCITIGIGLLFSILMHIAIVFDWHVDRLEPLDIAFANLTLWLIGLLVVFKRIPEWALPLLFTGTILNAVFWDEPLVYMGMSVIFNALVTFYILYRLCNPSPLRNNVFMIIALIIGIIGSIFFILDGHHHDKDYAIIHSVWHISSYSALYFLLRSTNTTLRIPRVDFSSDYNNIIAYKSF